jgi:hypothetical protein
MKKFNKMLLSIIIGIFLLSCSKTKIDPVVETIKVSEKMGILVKTSLLSRDSVNIIKNKFKKAQVVQEVKAYNNGFTANVSTTNSNTYNCRAEIDYSIGDYLIGIGWKLYRDGQLVHDFGMTGGYSIDFDIKNAISGVYYLTYTKYYQQCQGYPQQCYQFESSGTVGSLPLTFSVIQTPYSNSAAFYRFFNPYAGRHFYTHKDEANWLGNDWTLEDVVGYVKLTQETDTTPLYRYYRAASNDHAYLTSSTTPTGYVSEGIEGYVYTTPGTNRVAIHCYFKSIGDHLYTQNYSELGGGNSSWAYEGIKFYLLQ